MSANTLLEKIDTSEFFSEFLSRDKHCNGKTKEESGRDASGLMLAYRQSPFLPN